MVLGLEFLWVNIVVENEGKLIMLRLFWFMEEKQRRIRRRKVGKSTSGEENPKVAMAASLASSVFLLMQLPYIYSLKK